MAEPGQRTVLAFDFGTRRIGVAVGNELLDCASRLDPLAARDGIPDWRVVERLVATWQPDLFVVGLPLELDGSELEMCLRARKFGKRLFGRFGIPCEMVDERGSTREGNYRQDGVDGIAAALILESWFIRSQEPPPSA
jgi:putative Holliday junction resolvase